MTKGTKGFFIWLRRELPQVYAEVKKEFKETGQLAGIGAADPIAASTEAPPSSTLAQTVKDIASTVAQVYLTREQARAQQQILNTQLSLAQRGLPLMDINAAQYGLQPSVGVGLTGDTKQLLTYGAIGVGVLWLLSMATRRKR